MPEHARDCRHLFCFGLGYTAVHLAPRLQEAGIALSGTCREAGKGAAWRRRDAGVTLWNAGEVLPRGALKGVTDILVSVPPDAEGCPALRVLGGALPEGIGWVGYLSSSAVYGDAGGGWIDETHPPAPRSRDAQGRMIAEAQWSAACARAGAALDRMRLSGIYGPGGRSPFDRLRGGDARARAIIKPGQVFNRIHVDDAAAAILAAMGAPDGDRALNLGDDLPAPAHEVLEHAARLAGMPAPERSAFDPAGLPPGVADFYAENRRLRNDRLKALPGFVLKYPDYRRGLAAILAAENAGPEVLPRTGASIS
ncbi:MAG: NAD-dependent epimerase/dehydratase family protein [Tropicimonas sp.]|uniref:NAD-dependent epimerase/dehydratase family protein n=1 Tax=Tropicimonas sp. TaxID=2067044 RepID=UPI003A85D06C